MTRRPATTPLAGREDPKEEQILTAARAEFMRSGYVGASMDNVAHRAHASKTTLYTRFPSKETLFAAVVAAECRRGGMDFPAEEFDDVPVDDALRQIGVRFLALTSSPEVVRIHQMIMGEFARFPEEGRAFLREGANRVGSAVAGYFARAGGRGLLAVDDPAFIASQFLAAIKGITECELVQNLEEHGATQDRENLVARVVTLFLDGVRPR